MSSITAFNDMMGQFLMELHKTFPEEKGLKKYITAFELLRDTHPKKIVSSFKGAIWQYIQTLYMLGTTITSIPAETLTMIENVAKQCADKMQSEGGDIDESQLMKSMQGMLGGMMKK